MSKPRYNWWSHAKAIIRDYPELKQQYDDLHRQRVTQCCTGMPGGSGGGRVIEDIALRQLPLCKQREYDAVFKAINSTKRKADGDKRLHLIRMVYWDQTHTVAGAALKLYIHPQTGKNWHRDFVYEVGKNMGWQDGL